MPELTPGQRMMVEDGLPAEAILDPKDRKAAWVGRKLTKVRDLKTPPKDEDPATRALRKEMARAAEQKKAERFARLKQLKTEQEKTMTKTAKKAPAKKPAAKAPKTTARKPAAKKAGKTPAAVDNARTPAGARPDGLREGSKQAVMLDMVLAPNGATEAEICKKLGWKKCRVTLKRVCEKVGVTLLTSKVDDKTVFTATRAQPAE